ncbi:conjugative relaxase-like TrwC/TraI family protein [Sphingomonas zeicaulis]|uniref:MobF family relaxase n=1 Tax=Sphingomonas zeicaulis TaxID=1632740 RepID=UPI003D263AAE
MHSIASVRSASGAANYFAKDDYYTVEGSAEVSEWGGEGAAALGLEGEVTKDAFENILNGVLPDGEKVGQVANRQPGIDMTFSMPKSLSVMAYVAGDKRLLAANLDAVKKTMKWVEANLAEGRKDIDGRKVPHQTGNLVYALFEHDTSRALDPQGHIHAVVANLTRMADGNWQALHNGEIWKHNSVIGSIYHAFLKENAEKLGYLTVPSGKHGTFELHGVPKKVIEAFSQRSQEIREKASELGIKSTQGLRDVTTRTRDAKLNVEDREALRESWREKAAELGFTGKDLLDAAMARAGRIEIMAPLERGVRAVSDAIGAAVERIGSWLRPNDPLVGDRLDRSAKTPDEARAALAVASAVRMLSEREAAFPANQIAKTALDFGLKGVTIEGVEARIDRLVKSGGLIPGEDKRQNGTVILVTTPDSLATETRILERVDAAREKASPIVDAAAAGDRLRATQAHELNAGQLAAATLILSSSDAVVIIQGDAGTGKSTMLQPTVQIAKDEGRPVLGLAIANKVVNDLAADTGSEAQTIASFVANNEKFITDRTSPDYQAARQKLEGALVVVDETSQVPSGDMLKLLEIREALGIDKMALIGDRKQLLPVGAGKMFSVIQNAGATMTRMSENLRQRTDTLRTVAALAGRGRAGDAMKVLGDNVVEAESPEAKAAETWLALPPEDRATTAVITSGRAMRSEINQRIQDGLAAEGTLKGGSIMLTVHDRVNTTSEELRYASTYRPGMTLEVSRGGVRTLGLDRGRYSVVKLHPNGKVELSDGRKRLRIDPQRISPGDTKDRLVLTQSKTIELREGDRIRWTERDKTRDLLKHDTASVSSIDTNGVTVATAQGKDVTLPLGDAMLSRVDLAYAINMHVAQGMTTSQAIVAMASHERHLANQRLFNVAVTRVRDGLTLVVDNVEKLTRQLNRNPGDKTSSLETTGQIGGRGGSGPGPAEPFDPGPVDGAGTPDLPPLPDLDALPPLPSSDAEKVEGKPDRDAPPPPPPPPADSDLPPLPDQEASPSPDYDKLGDTAKGDAPGKEAATGKKGDDSLGIPPGLLPELEKPALPVPERQLGLDL